MPVDHDALASAVINAIHMKNRAPVCPYCTSRDTTYSGNLCSCHNCDRYFDYPVISVPPDVLDATESKPE